MMHVFLSWSGDTSKAAANAFKLWLRHALPKRNVKVFFSPDDVGAGWLWREVLRTSLKESSLGVFFLSRDNLDSPWILFEGGAIGKLPRSRVFTVLLDIMPRDLPQPFEQYQATVLSSDSCWKLVAGIATLASRHGARISTRALRSDFDAWWPDFRRLIQSHIERGLTGSGDWQAVSGARIASRIGGSPFEARQLFRIARQRIDFVAQNHHYMTVDHPDDHLEMLKSFLDNAGRKVQFLAMDPQKRNAVAAWTELMGTADFPKDLRDAVATLRKWGRLAFKEKWKGTLKVRVTGLVPTSQTFVDAETARGCSVVTPMGRKPSNADRSSFFLEKGSNRDAFSSYWTMYLEQWRRARPL